MQLRLNGFKLECILFDHCVYSAALNTRLSETHPLPETAKENAGWEVGERRRRTTRWDDGADYAIERDIVICMQRIWREEQRDQTD